MMSTGNMAKEIVERIIHGACPIEEEIKWVTEKIKIYAQNCEAIGIIKERKQMIDFSEQELLKIQEFIRLASDNVDGAVWAEYYYDDAQKIQAKLLTAILQKKGMIE